MAETVDRLRLELPNTAASLESLHEELERFVERHPVLAPVHGDLRVSLDEVVTNVVRYGYTDDRPHRIVVELALHDQAVEAVVVDDGRPFNPLEAPEPRTDGPLAERPIGGLGIHFVRQLMDELDYRREDGRNRLTLRKRLPRA